MKERLKKLRSALNLNQQQFSSAINISRSAVAGYETGTINIPDRTIVDICRVFNVNELWLRTGSGEMFRQETNVEVELAHQVGRLIKSDDDFTKRLVLEYLKLPPELKTAFEEFVDKLYQEHKKE
ncbi:helix-turn-helix transcriptional regulator [Phascolarctobacterium succinatutens]|uniref:helix-turn-helix domain-containing protein n=1 Tax=Phascolarctobacterium succinatutens TaxID=626940 RepID=UPI0030796076